MTITVKQLIEELKKFDPNQQVFMSNGNDALEISEVAVARIENENWEIYSEEHFEEPMNSSWTKVVGLFD